MNWLRRFLGRNKFTQASEAPRRVKTYSADTGYVIQYFLAGFRDAPIAGGGWQYAFDYSYNRTQYHHLIVELTAASVRDWESEAGRSLTASERFGIAKITLKRTFDSLVPANVPPVVSPSPSEVRDIAEFLGL